MAKIRVYELSKALGTENKALLDFLRAHKVDVKGHMSSVTEEEAELAKKHFAGGKKETDAKPPQEAAAAEKPPQEAPPKKKKIIRVVHPSNAQHGQGRGSRMQDRRGPSRRFSGNYRGVSPRPERLPQDDLLPGMMRTSGGIRTAGRIRSAEELRELERKKEEETRRRLAAMEQAEKAAAEAKLKEEAQKEAQAKADAEKPQDSPSPKKPAKSAAPEEAAPVQKEAAAPVPKEAARPEPAPVQKRIIRTESVHARGRDKNKGAGRREGTETAGKRPQEKEAGRRENASARTGRDFGRRLAASAPAPGTGKPGAKDAHRRKKDRRDNRQREEEAFNKKNLNRPGAFHKPARQEKPKEEEAIKLITVPATITIQELADKMKLAPSAIVKKLFMKGTMVTVNQEIEYEMAEEIALDFDVLCEQEKAVDYIEELLKEEEENEENLRRRPPVVCVMGHVDHGKTSLLDKIRHTNVTDKEAGGITQHIGAYVVSINGENITFLDTPGHEAFTAMRLRGAQSTDIAILVVAADDGVMPQTIEAINHAKAAGIEILVAINKIDKPGANPERVKQELSEYELVPEDWGGKTICVPVSAKTGEGIDTLLEMILLTAEVLELKADPNRTARGLVLEAQLDKGRGPVATVLVQKGTLRVGEPVAAGIAYGKVRAMIDDRGRRVKEAGPSRPVEILGLNDVPGAGDVFIAPKTDREARHFAETFIAQSKLELVHENKSKVKMSLEDLYAQIQEGNLKELDIIVKADVQGSVEAVKQSLEKLSNEEVVVKVIHGGVGAISESDISLASASNAIVIGFNVRPDATAKETAEREGVDIRLYRVIYNAIEDVEAAMKGMLEPDIVEEVMGHAQVRQIFHASGVGTIAGAYVADGKFERDCQTRIIRDGIVVYEGALASLHRFKDDVKEVKAGFECGFVFDNFNDVKENDDVEAFKMVEVARA